jgi:hypothetical protein
MKTETKNKKPLGMLGLSLALLATSIFSNACKKEKPEDPAEDTEIITTVELRFKDSANTANVLSYVWEDRDGEGGNTPNRQDSIRLDSGKTYIVELKLSDVTKSPVADISAEIKAEADDHQIYYTITPAVAGLSATITDKDSKGFALGLESIWKVRSSKGKGRTINVLLKHKPGVKTANDANTVGETDIDVNFPLRIK